MNSSPNRIPQPLGWGGCHSCFNYDGNQTGCGEFEDDCVWFSESGCYVGEPC